MDSNQNSKPTVATGGQSSNDLAAAAREGLFSRNVREQAKSGTCFICTEGEPNIVTLCCGQAVHYHCMTKWFMDPQRESCPYCRAALQSGMTHQQSDQEEQQQFEMPTQYLFIAEDESVQSVQQMLYCSFCNNPAARDCENVACGRCCGVHGQSHCARHDGPPEGNGYEDISADYGQDAPADYGQDTSADYGFEQDYDQPQHQQQQDDAEHCTSCQERMAARGCVNGSCKRCCVAHGRYPCERHDSAEVVVQDALQCFGCYNRAAQECINQGCARCCVQSGHLTCNRHTNW
jgi:hypothetical protein